MNNCTPGNTRQQKLAPLIPRWSWLIYTKNLKFRPHQLIIFSPAISNWSWYSKWILILVISTYTFYYSPCQCGIHLWCSILHACSFSGWCELDRCAHRPFAPPFQLSRTRPTYVVLGTTTVRNDSTTKTPGDTSSVYSVAELQTCWMDENLPAMLLGAVRDSVVWCGW